MIFRKANRAFLSPALILFIIIFLLLAFEPKVVFSEGNKQTDVTQYHLERAKNGSIDSQFWLGLAYAKGLEGERDIVKAYMWLDIAAKNGKSDAALVRDTIDDKMSAAEIEKAKKLSSNWKQDRE